ncbi:MAG: hypothetical protein KDB60_05365 [Propionibacteriaceae bacterium]|nr:hypothetical protein [Propionibacteriaceae bacterium]
MTRGSTRHPCGWAPFVAATDIAWGVVLGALVTGVATLLLRRLRVITPHAAR